VQIFKKKLKNKQKKKTEKTLGWVVFKKTRVFSNPDTRSARPAGSAGVSASA
jgi:hypothetical protein